MTTSTTSIAKIVTVAAGLAMFASLSLAAAPAYAQSVTFNADLTIGSTGADVTALQTWLIGKGYSIPAGATGYFGTQTQAAVAAYQAANGISPAVGYFGPITRAHVNSMGAGTVGGGSSLPAGCTSTAGYSPTTGAKCDSGSTLPAGCTSTVGYSSTTGVKCDSGASSGGTTTGGALRGGAGSIDSFDELSEFSNEEVGEDEEDVEVAGIEIENGDESDIELTAVRLDFSTQPSNDDLDEFITEVSIWLDGKEVARVDADDFNDDNDWTRTVSLKSGAVIEMGETAELTVAVSGVSNIDSGDAGDDWAVDFVSVRYKDAQGASVTDNTNTDAFTWDVNTFASAANVELKVALSDDNLDSHVVDIDDNDDTDGVELLRFTLEAEGGDIEIKDLPVTFATSTSNTSANANQTLAEIASTVYIVIDGEEYSENTSGAVQGSAGATVTFDDIDYTIEEGDEIEVIVKADINDTEASVFTDGDALTASVSASNVASIDAEDETGEDLADADMTGTALGDAVAFYDVGIMVSLVSVSATPNVQDGDNNDSATFTIVFDVEAFDGTVYVADTADATIATDPNLATSAENLYRVTGGGTATATGLTDTLDYTTTDGAALVSGNIELADGEKTRMTLSVARTSNGPANNGFFQAFLEGIKWNTSNDTTAGNGFLYTFDLEDYKTGSVNIVN